jgi:predicted glutamine amidotransferase
MCILLQHPAGTKFSNDQLADFFSKNSDGFGAIVKQGDSVNVLKSIGDFKEVAALYHSQVAGNEAIIHFRMRTHGDIDISNCHPYEVIPGIWMAHNGVLSTGNKGDDKMSDTWHYIQDYLKPILEKNPELLAEPAFQKLIASHIGASNKFAFMNQKGESFIINKSSGVMHEDVWYSNTYAWSPSRFGYYQSKTYTYPKSSYGLWDDGEYDHSKFATSNTWKQWNEIDKRLASEVTKKQQPLPLAAPVPRLSLIHI